VPAGAGCARARNPFATAATRARRHGSLPIMKPAALLLGLAAEVAAHGAVTFPPSRNAIDADIYPGNGSRLPNLPIPFEFWCPMPDAAAAAAHGEPPSSGCPHASPPAQSGRAGGGANRPLTTATYAECQKACCADAGCVQWAWDSNLKASARPPQCSGTGGCCWLKSAMGVDKGPCSGAGQAGCVSWSGTSGNHGATPSENKYNLSGANGQACFWFNNGCDLSCDECDGTTGAQAINFHAQFVANSSMPGSWWSGKGIRPNPNVKFPPPHAICKNPKHNATICDPKLRTANVNAECGSNEDFYYYAPWRAPGRSPVIDSCGMAGGRHPGQGHGQAGADYHSTPNAPLGTFGSKLPPRPTGTVRWRIDVIAPPPPPIVQPGLLAYLLARGGHSAVDAGVGGRVERRGGIYRQGVPRRRLFVSPLSRQRNPGRVSNLLGFVGGRSSERELKGSPRAQVLLPAHPPSLRRPTVLPMGRGGWSAELVQRHICH
jgi:hypothetical protein